MLDLLLEGLKVTIFSMAIVFFVLIILMYIIKFQNRCLKNIGNKKTTNNIEKKKIEKEAINQEVKQTSLENDKEIVAVIAASLSMYMDRPVNDIKIKSIKRIENSLDWRKSGIKFINI